MATQDVCVTIHPYFKIKTGQHESFRFVSQQLVESARKEKLCLYYGFSFNGDRAFCREGYVNAEGLLFHLQSVGPLIQELLKFADMDQLEIHAIESELVKLREPLSSMNPKFYALESGFRK